MRRLTIIALLALAACGSAQRVDRAPKQEAKARPAKVSPLRGNPGIIGAMDQIPSSERGLFQKAMACEVGRNAAKRKPAIVVTPDYLTDLHGRLARNPKLATC